jgi:signal transduction histidine kinase
VPPELAASRRVDEERVLSSGEPLVDCVDRIVRPDGSIRWLSATKAPIHDAEGNVAGLVEIARDITENKRQEQLKNEFIATVSHELRTPLTSIQGALGVLASGPADPLPDRVKRMIAIALDNCRRLVRIVNDILDIERMESGLMTLVRKPVELRGLIAQAVQASQSAAEDHHVAIRIESPRDPITIMTDPDRLAQVLANLLSNAIKFSPPDGEVVVGVEQADQCARIHVRDHGPGIPQEYRHRIFDKFVQVDATDQRRRGGTGLGLSIARQIVLQLNGTIDFETGAGCGTTFTIALPAIAHTAASDITPRLPAREFVSDPAP